MGQSAMAPTAVVQLGLATSGAETRPSPLISGITSGVFSSMRHAEELSTTCVFRGPPEILGDISREKSPETARRQISHSCAASMENGSTMMSPNFSDLIVV